MPYLLGAPIHGHQVSSVAVWTSIVIILDFPTQRRWIYSGFGPAPKWGSWCVLVLKTQLTVELVDTWFGTFGPWNLFRYDPSKALLVWDLTSQIYGCCRIPVTLVTEREGGRYADFRDWSPATSYQLMFDRKTVHLCIHCSYGGGSLRFAW